eukprot:UN27630
MGEVSFKEFQTMLHPVGTLDDFMETVDHIVNTITKQEHSRFKKLDLDHKRLFMRALAMQIYRQENYSRFQKACDGYTLFAKMDTNIDGDIDFQEFQSFCEILKIECDRVATSVLFNHINESTKKVNKVKKKRKQKVKKLYPYKNATIYRLFWCRCHTR